MQGRDPSAAHSATALELQLGQEELLFLLRLTGVPTLPGLDAEELAGLRGDDLDRLLAAGEHSLRARGLIAEDATAQEGVAVSDALLAVLGTCVSADSLLTVRREPLNEEGESRFYHFGADLTVEHSLAGPGVHRFWAATEAEAAIDRVMEALALQVAAPETSCNGADQTSARVRQSALETARQQAVEAGNKAGATTTLETGGMAAAEARALASALEHLQTVSTVTFLRRVGDETTDGGGVVVLEGGDALWLVEPVEDSVVECQWTSPDGVRARIAAMVRATPVSR